MILEVALGVLIGNAVTLLAVLALQKNGFQLFGNTTTINLATPHIIEKYPLMRARGKSPKCRRDKHGRFARKPCRSPRKR